MFGQILRVVSGAQHGIPRSWSFIAPRALWSGQRRTMATNGNGASQQILSGTKGGIPIQKEARKGICCMSLNLHQLPEAFDTFGLCPNSRVCSSGEESTSKSRKVWIQI